MIDILGCRKRNKSALIIGKFWPFHKGHEYLIAYACETMRGNPVDILVCQHPEKEAFPIEYRADAIRNFIYRQDLEKQVGVLTHVGEDPQDPSESNSPEEFWDHWKRIIGNEPYTHVFSSEEYGWQLAKELGCEHIPVNPARSAYNISGSKIRNDFRKHWNSISDGVKPFLQQIVYVTGPESCGKTTLAQQLAEEYNSVYVPEYGRDYFEFQKYKELICTKDDLLQILQGHQNSINAAIRLRTPFIFVDTDATATWLFNHFWYDNDLDEATLYIETEKHMIRWNRPIYLLCAPDLPWEKDPLRNLEDTRQEFFDLNARLYDNRKQQYHVITGTGENRFNQAKTILGRRCPPVIL